MAGRKNNPKIHISSMSTSEGACKEEWSRCMGSIWDACMFLSENSGSSIRNTSWETFLRNPSKNFECLASERPTCLISAGDGMEGAMLSSSNSIFQAITNTGRRRNQLPCRRILHINLSLSTHIPSSLQSLALLSPPHPPTPRSLVFSLPCFPPPPPPPPLPPFSMYLRCRSYKQ